jgi:hypothetical protein
VSAERVTRGRSDRFISSAALVAVSVVTAAALLQEEGRGQRVNRIELQAG